MKKFDLKVFETLMLNFEWKLLIEVSETAEGLLEENEMKIADRGQQNLTEATPII